MIEKDFYSIREIAEALSITPRQVQNYCKKGTLPYYQCCAGGKITIKHEDYINWLLSNKRK